MKSVTKYLSQYSTNPISVDRLIISAFLVVNKLEPKKNIILKSYLINVIDEDEYISLMKFVSVILEENIFFGFERLIELFEFVISPADRIINGAIYTPEKIRNYIVKEALFNDSTLNESIRISDIACGCGGFLFNASVFLKEKTGKNFSEIFKNNIFGLDIQEYSIIRAKLLLSLLALQYGEEEMEYEFNLFQGDSLDFDWNLKIKKFEGFNIILGNPPYVCARNLDEYTKEKIKKWEVCSSGNPDLYIPFFQIAIENLAIDGVLGFITMNSFFKSLNGRALRAYFQRKNLIFDIIDFGAEQIFKSKNTYTCICFIKNNNRNYISYAIVESENLNKKIKKEKIYYDSLNSVKGWNLNSNKIISKIESVGTPFGQIYQTRHGIATLKNDIYIFKPINEDSNYYYFQRDELYKVEKGICRNIINSNKLSRKKNLNDLEEKIIFPYDQQLKPKLMKEKFFIENFPFAYEYLKKNIKILNSRDKGKGKYDEWYAFGRTQSLEKIKNKMFFPKFSDRTPDFIVSSDENLFFYNGLAVVGSSDIEMEIVKKIMESSVFWYYIKKTSKPYSSNYYSLNGNYIRNFGVCELNEEEKNFLLSENDREKLNIFFENKYDIKFL
jgi:adenine-specific DNA-methyltransferase